MNQCRANKRNGTPCSLLAAGDDGFCWAHSPDKAAKRKRITSKAGKSKGNSELTAIKKQLQDIANRVLSGELDTKLATAATQALNCLLRGVEIEHRLVDLKEIEQQLQSLENQAQIKQNNLY